MFVLGNTTVTIKTFKLIGTSFSLLSEFSRIPVGLGLNYQRIQSSICIHLQLPQIMYLLPFKNYRFWTIIQFQEHRWKIVCKTHSDGKLISLQFSILESVFIFIWYKATNNWLALLFLILLVSLKKFDKILHKFFNRLYLVYNNRVY